MVMRVTQVKPNPPTLVEDAVRSAIEQVAEVTAHDWLAAAIAVEVTARRIALEAEAERRKGWS